MHVGSAQGRRLAERVFEVRSVGFAFRATVARVVLERESFDEPLVAIEAHDERVGERLAHAQIPAAALAAVAATIVDEQARPDVVVLATERDRELVSLDAIEEILGPPADMSLLERELISIVEPDRQA